MTPFLVFLGVFLFSSVSFSTELFLAQPVAVMQPPGEMAVDPNGLSLAYLFPSATPTALSAENAVEMSLEGPSPPPSSGFDITINYSGSWTAEQIAIFEEAEALWESWILDYKPGITLTGITIDASSIYIDGPGAILGQAGPTYGETQAGYTLATEGIMEFDEDDVASMVASGLFDEVVVHEMAHVIGFGTLWTYNGVYTDGTGQYLGGDALAMFQMEFQGQSGAASVPVELDGTEGNKDAHWNEGAYGGATGILNLDEVDMRYELMTAWLNTSGQQYLSQTTIQSFSDIGYIVDSVPVPEPSSLALIALGLLGLAGGARWRKA